MLLGFFTVIIMLACSYAAWRQGVLPAFAMLVNVLLAGLIAFNFFELLADQLAPMLGESFLEGYEDGFCLVAVFSLTLGILRLIANTLIHTILDYHPIVQQVGAALIGLLTGYLVAGFLVCVAQTLPASEHFLQFEARVVTDSSGKIRHRSLPSDRIWLALMQRASLDPFSWGDSAFDPDGSFEFRYRARRHADTPESHE